MNQTTLLDKYRSRFVMTLLLTVAIVTAVEIGAYIFFVMKGMCAFSLHDPYLRWNVLLPIALNWSIQLTAMRINKVSRMSQDAKNSLVIFAATAVSFVTTVVHREYIVIMGAFIFPLIFSATFNNKKLFNRTAWMALGIICVTAIFLWKDDALDLKTIVNLIVMIGFLIVSYFGGHLSIDFSKSSFNLIRNHEETNEQLQNIVLRDQMTGLYNHRTFYSELEASIQNADEGGDAFCLAMIDIDDFKSVNDSYGHDSGDAVLKTLAQILEKHCDASDRPCRYGGEEFAVIFNHADIQKAKKIMEKILKEFGAIRYAFSDTSVTFSCGMAVFEKGIGREALFNLADSRMYQAKKNGKNQIVAI